MARQLFLLGALLPLLASSYMLVSPSRPAALSSAQSTLLGNKGSQAFADITFGVDERSRGSMEMMRHGNRLNRLGKPADQRKALLRALTTEVIRHGRIKTTLIRAKVVRKWVDKMISLSKRGTLHARRQALAWVYDKDLVAALFEQAPERYADRQGGYCRVLRTTNRKGDNAKMGIIELV